MSHDNYANLITALAPLVLAVAALIRAYAATIEARVNSRRLDRVEKATDDAHERVNFLESGNLVDAAVSQIKPGDGQKGNGAS